MTPAQMLLTRNDFSDRTRYRNAYATMMELLERKILPIINENDSVSIEELTFGDNDMLSALVSGLIHADQLIILTDINGIYDANPNEHPEAKRFDVLTHISEELFSYAKRRFKGWNRRNEIEALSCTNGTFTWRESLHWHRHWGRQAASHTCGSRRRNVYR